MELIGKYGVCQFCKNPNDDNKKSIYCLSCKNVSNCKSCNKKERCDVNYGCCVECCLIKEKERAKELEEEKQKIKEKIIQKEKQKAEKMKEKLKPKSCLVCKNVCVLIAEKCRDCLD